MKRFSNHSLQQLATLHPNLQRVLIAALCHVDQDFTIHEGHRSQDKQLARYKAGDTKVKFGAHNQVPARAADLLLYPDTNRDEDYEKLARQIQAIGKAMGILIAWGGDFAVTFHGRKDIWHFELA